MVKHNGANARYSQPTSPDCFLLLPVSFCFPAPHAPHATAFKAQRHPPNFPPRVPLRSHHHSVVFLPFHLLSYLSRRVRALRVSCLSKNHRSKKRQARGLIRRARVAAMGRSWSWSLRLLFLASLLLLSSALPTPSPSPRRGSGSLTELTAADEALLARMCDPRSSRPAGVPLAWCHELHLRRRRGGAHHRHHHHHHMPVPVPLPPPGRDGGEEIDARYGVAKRLVPTGPNPLHN